MSRALRFPRRDRAAVIVYFALAILPAAALVQHDRLWAAVALAPAILGPWGIVASGALLRLAYVGTGFSDQVAVAEAARERLLGGASPFGVGYAESYPPGSPYVYGPLGLLDSVPLQLAAAIGLLLILAACRRPLTLAIYAGLPFSIALASAGNNDFVPALFLAAGLLALPRGWGGLLIGLSVLWKPYTAVFLPVAMAIGAPRAFLIGLATTVVGWLPVLWWGGFPESLRMLNEMQGASALRFLAAPATAAAFRWGIPAACVAFALLTLTSEVWSLAYLIPLGVPLGIWLEPPTRRQREHRNRPIESGVPR